MKFELFYRNPRLTFLVVALILVSGLSSYAILPRMEDPVMQARVAIVYTPFPGATSPRVDTLVTEKIEDELKEVEEIKSLRSVSRAGMSRITIELKDDVNGVAKIWSRVRDKLDDAHLEMPSGVAEPDFTLVDMKAYALVVGLKWTSDEPVNYSILNRLAKELKDDLKDISGTEVVDTFGDPQEEINVDVRPEELSALGLDVQGLARQMHSSDAKVAAGFVRNGSSDLVIELDGELDSLDRLRRTPIHYGTAGNFVLLGDIASISKGIQQPVQKKSIIDGSTAVVLGAFVQDQKRIDHWTADVEDVLNRSVKQLPRGVEQEIVMMQNEYVEQRLSSLLVNLGLGAAAVTTVIFFLMGWRSALIVGAALPLSALMVLTGLNLLGIPLHQMSITGLIIALGLLIDNAIVVVDEVRKQLHKGHTPGQAITRTIQHLAIPLLGSTLTTIFAFAPLAMMPGPAGEFVGSIGISVILAIASSLIVSLTILPVLVVAGVRGSSSTERLSWWRRGISSDRMSSLYRSSLDKIVARPWIGVAFGLALPISGIILATQLPEQFFPAGDRDQVVIKLHTPPHASIEQTEKIVQRATAKVLAHPDVSRVNWFLGESAPTFYYNLMQINRSMPNFAQGLVQLNTKVSSAEIVNQLQRELSHELLETEVIVMQLEQGPPLLSPIEVRVFGDDVEKLKDFGDQITKVLAETPHVIRTHSDLGTVVPKLSLEIDEEATRLANLDRIGVAGQLNSSLEGAVGGSILEETEEVPVRVRVAAVNRATPLELMSMNLVSRSPSGNSRATIPLSSVARLKLQPDGSAISRFNGRRMNEVQANIEAGVLASEVQTDFQQRLKRSGFELPSGYQLTFAGESEQRDQAVGNLMASAGVLLILMITTLVISFGSFRVTALIGVVGICSVGLGLGALWTFGFPFGFMAIVGTMGLVGVAINDSIVVLAAIRADASAVIGNPTAIGDVVFRSTRHVVATTFTTVVGFLPLIVSGGGFWPPLAVAIAGGVGGATLLALYFVPAAYMLSVRRTETSSIPVTNVAVSDEVRVRRPALQA